jgi:tryptophan-rich sensory protein
VLNVGWSAVFFGLRMPGLAFGELLALWVALAATLVASWRVSRSGAALLVPYFLWVSFAAVLNFAIWRLNA